MTTQTGRGGWLRDRTRLYHIVRLIGRWSMIDIFMKSLLGALVNFGAVSPSSPASAPSPSAPSWSSPCSPPRPSTPA